MSFIISISTFLNNKYGKELLKKTYNYMENYKDYIEVLLESNNFLVLFAVLNDTIYSISFIDDTYLINGIIKEFCYISGQWQLPPNGWAMNVPIKIQQWNIPNHLFISLIGL